MTDGSSKKVDGRFARLAASIPGWARPMFLGAGIMLLIVGGRALIALIILPFALAGGAKIGPDEYRYVGLQLAGALAYGSLSGALYAGLGKPFLMKVPKAGPYLTGIICLWPYGLLLLMVYRARHHEPLFASLKPFEWGMVLFIGLFVGLVGGQKIFGPSQPPAV